MAPTPNPNLLKASTMVATIDKVMVKLRPRYDTFVKDVKAAIEDADSDEIDVVLGALDKLQKDMDACVASTRGAIALYTPLAKDAAVMATHRAEVTEKVHHLVKMQNELVADLKALDDWESKANKVGNAAAGDDKKMRTELAALKFEVDELTKKADAAIAAAPGFYDAATTAYGERDQKKLTDARVALIDCQAFDPAITTARGKIAKFKKTYIKLDQKSADSLEKMDSDLEYEAGQMKKIGQMVKDAITLGQVKKIDAVKAATLLKITDKKEIDQLKTILNTPQKDLEKALGPIAKKHNVPPKSYITKLENANMF